MVQKLETTPNEDAADALEARNALIEDADFRVVAQGHNAPPIVLPEGASRGDTIAHLSRGTPTNEFGLPVYYLRSDFLDVDGIRAVGHTTQQDVDASIEVLTYADGYPTFASGAPFWEQMPHEPKPSHYLFKAFLDLAELEGLRLLDSLARHQNIPLERVKEASLEYYWSARARAYDLFIVAAEAKKKEALTRRSESRHYNFAEKILDQITTRLDNDPELIESMDAEALFDLFDKMAKMQRLSLGLTGQNASTINKTAAPMGASVEMIFRQMTQNAGISDNTTNSIADRLHLLMQDESTALMAQEVIVRATAPGNLVNANSV